MRNFIFMLMLSAPVMAQDGGQLYGLYCSACHAVDGKGATGGQFPPLASSAWPLGAPERAIKIVLLGLQGPVEVNGSTYNLEMPPQGAALPDDQIAAILTYVRSSWGNKASAVTTDLVKSVRASLGKRNESWTAEQLLKMHPLENLLPPVDRLISHYYKGTFQEMPDFSQLTPTAVEEEPKGLIDYSDYANTNDFAMMWEGEITTPAGNHEFYLDSDDGSRLLIDGQMICEIKSIGPAGRTVKKTIAMKGGVHKIRVEYYEFAGQEALSVGVKFAGSRGIKWYSRDHSGSSKSWPETILQPESNRAIIYRNFIQGSTARGMGVGFPGGINMAFSADHLAPELLWHGDFIDAGHHWTDRGVGYEPPAGEGIVRISNKMAYAFTTESQQGWPSGTKIPHRFRGYQLNPQGFPTYALVAGGLKVEDRYSVVGTTALERTITVDGQATQPVSLLILAEHEMVQDSPTIFRAGPLKVEIKGGSFRYSQNSVILDLTKTTFTIRYTWL